MKTATTVAEAYALLAAGVAFDVDPEVMEQISIGAEEPMIIDSDGEPDG